MMNPEFKPCKSCEIGSCALYTLNEEEISSMQSSAHFTRFKNGEILRRQDTPLDSIIYLRAGYVKEFIQNQASSDQVVQIIKPRSYIGLQGLCINTYGVFSYQALTDIEVCFIQQDTFGELIRGNGNFAREIIIAMSNESLNNQRRFLGINQKQTFGKVAGLLLYLANDVYEKDHFELHLNRSELAQMVATTRESVTRALSWFRSEGIIALNNNKIEILDRERLNQYSHRG